MTASSPTDAGIVHDARVWRVTGSPLVAPTARGILDGHSVAVKDLFAVAGRRIGAGNPSWLAEAPVQPRHATAVARLLDAGAAVAGIAHTDEFAYSLAGANAHYGTPPNPRAPGHLGGGSSSGPAAAVALGDADVGLGTDTGGSVRVPAAYQGLYGIRTTHGLVDRTGMLPLAPSFDTVGWLTRTAGELADVGRVLLPEGGARPGSPPTLSAPLLSLADGEVADAVRRFMPSARCSTHAVDLPGWAAAFRTVQAHEAWRQHGGWLTGRLQLLGADVRARFEYAATVTATEAAAARDTLDRAKGTILAAVGDGVLVLPSTPSAAPRLDADLAAVRAATMQLTCLAGIAGLPAVNVPLRTSTGLPCGACLLAAPGSDAALLELAVDLAGRSAT